MTVGAAGGRTNGTIKASTVRRDNNAGVGAIDEAVAVPPPNELEVILNEDIGVSSVLGGLKSARGSEIAGGRWWHQIAEGDDAAVAGLAPDG